MNRKWSCLPTERSYVFKLQYGDKTFVKEVCKDSFYHTLNIQTYFEYHIIQLNETLKRALFPLTRDFTRRI